DGQRAEPPGALALVGLARGAGDDRVHRSRLTGLQLEPGGDELDHGVLRAGDVLFSVGKLTHHPAGEGLLRRAAERRRRGAGIEVRTELAARLSALDDGLELRERLVHLADLLLDLRAPGHLADEHADEVGVVVPRAQDDRRDLAQALARGLARLL